MGAPDKPPYALIAGAIVVVLAVIWFGVWVVSHWIG